MASMRVHGAWCACRYVTLQRADATEFNLAFAEIAVYERLCTIGDDPAPSTVCRAAPVNLAASQVGEGGSGLFPTCWKDPGWSTCTYPVSNALDGKIGTFTHSGATANGTPGGIQLDFGALLSGLFWVTMQGRFQCCASGQGSNNDVFVSPTTAHASGTRCAGSPTSTAFNSGLMDAFCSPPSTVRYLTITKTWDAVSMAEVRVVQYSCSLLPSNAPELNPQLALPPASEPCGCVDRRSLHCARSRRCYTLTLDCTALHQYSKRGGVLPVNACPGARQGLLYCSQECDLCFATCVLQPARSSTCRTKQGRTPPAPSPTAGTAIVANSALPLRRTTGPTPSLSQAQTPPT